MYLLILQESECDEWYHCFYTDTRHHIFLLFNESIHIFITHIHKRVLCIIYYVYIFFDVLVCRNIEQYDSFFRFDYNLTGKRPVQQIIALYSVELCSANWSDTFFFSHKLTGANYPQNGSQRLRTTLPFGPSMWCIFP